MRWRTGWVPAKNLLVDVLQDVSVQGFIKRLVDALFDVSDDVVESGGASETDITRLFVRWLKNKADIGELVQLLPDAIKRIFGNWDHLTETMIIGCLEPDTSGEIPELDFNLLTYEDVTQLRTAVFKCNDFRKMLETEKNSLVDVFSQMLNLDTSTGKLTESVLDGGPIGSPSLQEEVSTSVGSAT